MEIKITIEQLESLLRQQKELVIERLAGHTYYYNSKSTEGVSIPLDIDKIKFEEIGLKTRFPNEFEVLKKYVR